jgi:hypothetical protein
MLNCPKLLSLFLFVLSKGPALGEKHGSQKRKKNNPKNSGHFVPQQRLRAAHTLRLDQNIGDFVWFEGQLWISRERYEIVCNCMSKFIFQKPTLPFLKKGTSGQQNPFQT